MDSLTLLRRFVDTDASVVLIGGLAAVLQGVPIVTNDIDLCYDLALENRRKVVAALAPLHPALRVAGMSPEESRALPFGWDERTLNDTPNVTLVTDVGDIDLLGHVPGIGNYADVCAAAHVIMVDGIGIQVLDLPGLIAAKRYAGRPKDLMAISQIEATLLRRK